MADLQKLNRAFDVMALALGEAGVETAGIIKFVQNARRSFGVPQEEWGKTVTKAELAILAGELKEKADDSSVDRGSEAAQSGKTGRARASAVPG